MKKAVVAVLAILAAGSILCTGCSKKSGGMTIKPGVLSIGMEIGYPPMEYFDSNGNPIGFDVEMGNAIAAQMGLKAEFVDTAWDGIFAGVNTSKYDCIMSSVTINPVRLAAHNFSKPYVSNTLAMVLLKNSKITARTPEECTGLDVAFQSETTSDFYMEELAAKGLKYTPRRYEKVMYCFDELQLGRVDVIVTDLLVAYDYIAPANSPFEMVWTSTEDEQFGICMKKGNDELTQAIDKALDELFANGTMLRISNNIFGMDLVSRARK
ncbi:MAG: ABC transporter substrate-binding protein [Treponema sp.]|jgi:polar amino acid transport system substrate-binding protein|nr:ABC transporter substrate-binding protein [Treponema sp.]